MKTDTEVLKKKLCRLAAGALTVLLLSGTAGAEAEKAFASSASEPAAAKQPLPTEKKAVQAPRTRGEMEEMDYALLYPVFAWEAYPGATGYQVELLREEDDNSEHLTYMYTDENNYYADDALNRGGLYSWRVRALDGLGDPLSAWSEKRLLRVTAPTPVAALGDSITHGGGEGDVAACYRACSWETYARLPVKNLGRSGDTTQAMLDRFVEDVIPFAPQTLVIMGGVNDFREGGPAKESIRNLRAIRRLCRSYGITPVFATATPINPALMAQCDYIEKAAPNWLQEQKQLNEWIMKQKYAVDTAALLTAEDGTLRAGLTTDGLHPDRAGKKLIGEAIGKYLRQKGLAAEAIKQGKAEKKAKRRQERAARKKK